MNELIGGTLIFGGPAYVLFRSIPYLIETDHRVLAFAAFAFGMALVGVVLMNAYASVDRMGLERRTR